MTLHSFSDFDSLYNQKVAFKILGSIIQKKKYPSALIFSGINGIGKKDIAIIFSMSLNCMNISGEKKLNLQNDLYNWACMECNSCKKIISGTHPDIIDIKPAGKFIKILQIRELFSKLINRPFEAKTRIVIINNAHKMTLEASNALLKVLEEPPCNTLFILHTNQFSKIIPTIISRCQNIRFNPVSNKEIKQLIINKFQISSENACIITSMANGSIGKALELLKATTSLNNTNNIQWINKRNWLIEEIDNLLHFKLDNKDKTFYIINKSTIMAFAEKLSSKKNELTSYLEILKNYLRDIIIYKYYPEKIINTDLIDRIEKNSTNLKTKHIIDKIEAIKTAQKNILSNANLRLTIDTLVLRLIK